MSADAEGHANAPAVTPDDTTESSVGIPRRRRPVLPVPRSMRTDLAVPTRWFPLGTVDSGVLARADSAGLVQLGSSSWAIDWWIRSEERWHHPSMEATTAQRAVDDTPVLRTSVRVPGGEVVQQCAGAAACGPWSGPGVLLEVLNDLRGAGRGRVS
ncbi:MAG: hypothetical protein R2716_11180 [Microthrixaceae bacterium]